MFMTTLFPIGNVTIPSSWVALIIGFLIAYIVVRLQYGKKSSDVLLDAVFYFIIVWKLSVILTDFKIVMKWPLSILYFHGGRLGFYLGLLAASIATVIAVQRKNLEWVDRRGLLAGVVTVQAVYQVLMAFFNDNPFAAEMMTIILFTLLLVFFLFAGKKFTGSPVQLTFLFGAVHAFAAAFQPAGLTGTSVIATWLICLFFILFLFRKCFTEQESEGPL